VGLDVGWRLLSGKHPVGDTEYMWSEQVPLAVRLLSLFHVVWPVLLVWSLGRVGYDRRGFPLQVGIALCVLCALAVAIPSTRLEGFYLALATLALAQLFIVVLNEGGTVTGGTGGIMNYRLPALLGLRFTGHGYTVVIVLLVLGTAVVLRRLDRSWFGRACRAVRDNPEAAAAMGVDVARTKVIAFTLTSALAGAAGMVYAFVDNTVNPPIFGLENAFLLLFMVIIGGAGRHAGAVVGAVLLYLLPFFLAPLVGHHHALVFGVLMVAAILLQPRGLIGIYDVFRRRFA